jgi:hypothetical protein
VTAFCSAEAAIAASNSDGHRAWVLRDVLSKLEPDDAAAIRTQLDGIRRRASDPPTSIASAAAARFGQGVLGQPQPEPPLT